MKKEFAGFRNRFSMAVALILASSSASAAVNTWQGSLSSDFNDPFNWSLGALDASDTSTFTGPALVQPNVSADITVAKVNFALGSTNYVLSSSPGASLFLTTSPVIVSQSNVGTNTVSANLALSGGGAKFFNQAGPATLWVSGNISETTPGTQVKYERVSSAGGKYLITGQNTYSGDTTFLDGTFTITSFGNVGEPSSVGTSGTLWLANPGIASSRDAVLIYAGAGETTDKTIVIAAGSGSRTISTQGATGPLALNNLAIALTAALPKLTFSGDSEGNVLNALIPDPSASTITTVFKSGTGTWKFTANNVYTGPTTLNSSGGTLLVDGDQSAATGTVTVNTGAALGGQGIVGGSTTVATGARLLATLETGAPSFAASLTMNGGSAMTFEAVDAVAVAGALTLVNNWTLKLGSGFKNGGSTVLFSYGTLGASPDLVPTFDVADLGFTPTGPLSLTDTGSEIVLNGVRVPPSGMTVVVVR
jgi:autotransporter-associated beta strand protein